MLVWCQVHLLWLRPGLTDGCVRAANDVWMHARGIPGSHLIIRVPDGSAATEEDLQCAANLSVFYSRARESGRCDVAVTSGSQVKKPRGAKPGQVMVLKEQVRVGYPDKSVAALQLSAEQK